jgi:protein-S-isoprenylcysteine O-methyltransferase Ste14
VRARVIALLVHALVLVAPAWCCSVDFLQFSPALCIASSLLLAWRESREACEPQGPRGVARVLSLVSALSLFAVTQAAILTGCPSSFLCTSTGFALVVLGMTLRVRAIRALGAAFTSALEPGGALVVGGIYGRVRHPSDLGLVFFAFGLAMVGGSVLAGVLAAALTLPSVAIRIALEEQKLAAYFGPEWVRYRARVGLVF